MKFSYYLDIFLESVILCGRVDAWLSSPLSYKLPRDHQGDP